MFERRKLLRQRARVQKELPPLETDDFGFQAYKDDEFTKSRFRKIRAIDRRLAELASRRIIEQAQKLDIPIPSIEQGVDQEYEETTEFRSDLRKLIDEEKMRRREVMGWWWTRIIIPITTLLIGLAGAITGLVSVLHRK
jgi:hypothetical protein